MNTLIRPRPHKTRHYNTAALALMAALACALAAATSAPAAQLRVDSGADGNLQGCVDNVANDCTLRGAINKTNANADDNNQINFDNGIVVLLDDPLPKPTKRLTIDAIGSLAQVTGSPAYRTARCGSDDYALDITDEDATVTIWGLPFFALCDRAVKSNVTAPSIRIGPRLSDGSLPINGASPGGSQVEIFSADGPTTGDHEADQFRYTTLAPSGGYSDARAPEPTSGQLYTATSTGAAGTSGFAARARVPDDIASPVLVGAVATSNSALRLDFNEAVGQGPLAATAFSAVIGGASRPVVSAWASGASVYLQSSAPWATGEAGSVAVTGAGTVSDAVGNQLIGLPGARVFAGPGELMPPVIDALRFKPNRVCKRVSKKCKRGRIYAYITLNKPSRVIFDVLRGSPRSARAALASASRHPHRSKKAAARIRKAALRRCLRRADDSRRRRAKCKRTARITKAREQVRMVTFVRRLPAGRTKLRISSTVSGKLLPSITMTLRATAEDVARTLSVPYDAAFRVVKNRRDL